VVSLSKLLPPAGHAASSETPRLSAVAPAARSIAPAGPEATETCDPPSAKVLSDAALVEAALKGESWAQTALFQRHVRAVIGLAHRLVAHPAEVDDLVQDTFVHALNRLDTLKNPQAFASWIYSIVVRTASKRLRRQRLLTRLGLRTASPIDLNQVISKQASPEVASELALVYGMLEELPAEQRIALVLRRVEELELSEIAERMGLSVTTVKRRLAAAEASLARARGPA
jgi:RNA polymerase sigma-70 factor, ECF subfamily